ncbi:MAG: glycosyltransferase [Acidimicrobiia bacterium]
MRIAQIAPLYEAVPPVAYGGTERVIVALCDGLVELGRDVTLFVSEMSSTRARLEPMVAAPLRTRMTEAELRDLGPRLHTRLLAEIYERADEFDVIHSHLDVLTLEFTRQTQVPSVLTLHGRLDIDVVDTMLSRYPEVPLVSISDHQRICRARDAREGHAHILGVRLNRDACIDADRSGL